MTHSQDEIIKALNIINKICFKQAYQMSKGYCNALSVLHAVAWLGTDPNVTEEIIDDFAKTLVSLSLKINVESSKRCTNALKELDELFIKSDPHLSDRARQFRLLLDNLTILQGKDFSIKILENSTQTNSPSLAGLKVGKNLPFFFGDDANTSLVMQIGEVYLVADNFIHSSENKPHIILLKRTGKNNFSVYDSNEFQINHCDSFCDLNDKIKQIFPRDYINGMPFIVTQLLSREEQNLDITQIENFYIDQADKFIAKYHGIGGGSSKKLGILYGLVDRNMYHFTKPYLEKLGDKIAADAQYELKGFTSFNVACEIGHLELVKLLMANDKVDCNKTNPNRRTPFYVACEIGNLELVKLLMANDKVDCNKTGPNNKTPFYVACEIGNIELVKLLMANDKVDCNICDWIWKSPFYVVCEKGNIELVKLLLLKDEIDINQIHYQKTPFKIACDNGKVDIIIMILNSSKFNIINAMYAGLFDAELTLLIKDNEKIKNAIITNLWIHNTPKAKNIIAKNSLAPSETNVNLPSAIKTPFPRSVYIEKAKALYHSNRSNVDVPSDGVVPPELVNSDPLLALYKAYQLDIAQDSIRNSGGVVKDELQKKLDDANQKWNKDGETIKLTPDQYYGLGIEIDDNLKITGGLYANIKDKTIVSYSMTIACKTEERIDITKMDDILNLRIKLLPGMQVTLHFADSSSHTMDVQHIRYINNSLSVADCYQSSTFSFYQAKLMEQYSTDLLSPVK